MGLISRAIDKSPTWVQFLIAALAIPAVVYEVVHYGFWLALLRFIFSPTL